MPSVIDKLAIDLSKYWQGASFDAVTGKIRSCPAAPGSYTLTLRISDPFGGEDLQTWTDVGDLRASNASPCLLHSRP